MKEYHKIIIFTKTPLKAFFKFEDKFQIYPLDEYYLGDSKNYKHYPIILEFKVHPENIIKPTLSYDGIEDLVSQDDINETATIQTTRDKIINLLNLFSTFKFFCYKKSEGSWILPYKEGMTKEEMKNVKSSEFCFSYFFHKEINNFDINEFTNVSEKFKAIEVVEYSEYYQDGPNYDYDSSKGIRLPNNILYGLKGYYNLNLEEQKVMDSAIKYSVLCMELMEEKTTLAILSAFTSIETVMNFYYKDFKPENCPECSQPRYKISKRYIDFLLNFIGDGDGFKRRFSNLYSLRSKIVHTGFSFETEQFWNELNDQEKESEIITILEILMLSKLSVINYLILPLLGKKEKHHNLETKIK